MPKFHNDIRNPTHEWERRWNAAKDVTFAELQVGMKVVADECFTCLVTGAHRTVRVGDGNGEFFIACSEGRHYLDGQRDHAGGTDYVVGLRRIV